MGAWIFTVLADEIQQFDVGLVALAQRRFTQRWRQSRVLHGL
jgi:hypothetical protein